MHDGSKKIANIFLFGLAAAAWTVFLFNGTLQLRFPGFRNLAIAAIVFIIFLLAGLVARKQLEILFDKFTSIQKAALILFSVIFSTALILMWPISLDKYFFVLLPSHHLTVSMKPAQANQVQILQFGTSSGDLNPLTTLNYESGNYSWDGKVGDKVVLAFKPTIQNVEVSVRWDDFSQTVNLAETGKQGVVFASQVFPIPWFHTLLWFFFVSIALFSLVFIAALLLASMPIKSSNGVIPFVWFASPMLVMWGIYLLTFWPGLMSPDSITQWGEAQLAQFSDAHPALHTMFIWLLSRLWNSPAIVVIFHIVLLSLLVAWGLGELQKRNTPPLILWGVAIIFAFFPLNGLLVVSVWKDITYACALFAIFIQFFKIALSNGAWLKNNWNMAGFILAGLATAFSRHNGMPVVVVCSLILALVYRESWRRVAIMTGILMLLWAGIRGPFYSALNVKLYPGFTNILYLDHINAHIHAGTQLLPAEKTFLETLLPLSAWPYNCADSDIRKTDGPIPFEYFTQTPPEPARIALALFIRAPMVDIQHTLCSSSLVWKVDTGHYLSVTTLGASKDGIYHWISPNDFGLTEHSLSPGLVPLLANIYSEKDLLAKPVLYFLLSIFIFAVLALRENARILVIAVPLVIQTVIMLLVTYAQDFRYLYSTVLIAIFSLAFLFLPRSPKMKTLE